jgi:hypothetical protein
MERLELLSVVGMLNASIVNRATDVQNWMSTEGWAGQLEERIDKLEGDLVREARRLQTVPLTREETLGIVARLHSLALHIRALEATYRDCMKVSRALGRQQLMEE